MIEQANPSADPQPARLGPGGAAVVDGLPPLLPCWRLYLYVVASLGVYLLVWVYRTASVLESRGPRRRVKHAGWALGCCYPLFGALVLLELGRMADDRRGERTRRRDSRALLPALWLLLIAVVLWLTPLRAVFAAHLLLLTLPFLGVQATINAEHLVSLRPPPPPRHRLRRWMVPPLVLGGLAASASIVRRLDREAYAFAATLTAPDDRGVIGQSGRVKLVPPRWWIQVAPGTLTSSQSDLELSRLDRTASLVAYVRDAGGDTLATAVAGRRALIAAEGTLAEFQEARSFFEGDQYHPYSVATYQLGSFPREARYWVLTTLVDDEIIEIVTWSLLPAKDSKPIAALIEGFRPLERAGKDRP